jgi:glycosyltransferase involved in cell wall biosynthesis
MVTISVIVITKNEARNIRRCLRSVHGWVDEIIVLDSGSTDQTLEICRQFTAQVYVTDWPGYGAQKNRALQLAKSDWVLSLDADEWVRPALQAEIQQAIRNSHFPAFYMPRLNMFCGRFQRYGDAARDRVLRLFQRERGKFTNDAVHEKVICSSPIGHLRQPLLHNSFRTYDEWATQMRRYAELAAELRHTKGQRSNPIKAGISSGWIFFRSYILRQGFRSGRLGFTFAQLNAKSSFQKHWRLWQLGRCS